MEYFGDIAKKIKDFKRLISGGKCEDMKRVKFDDVVIGKEYFVKCGVWQARVLYVGMILRGNVPCPLFTFGCCIDDWKNNFNIHSAKSNIKVYELDI